MQLEILILSEVRRRKTNKYHTISLISGISNMTQIFIGCFDHVSYSLICKIG